jgi:hypothetical protein
VNRPTRHRDEGSALILVLALVVVGSLIVLPLLDYAISVGKANTVLSSKTKRQEAVKAGLRTALADPQKIYNHCYNSTSLASPGITGISVTTTCHLLGESLASADDELHLGLAATKVGEQIPDGMTAIVQKEPDGDPVLDGDGNPVRYVFENAALSTDWQGLDEPVSTPLTIWSPNLPVQGVSQRAAAGYQMPDGYPECTVYFPGTYTDPMTLDGPTFFTSGIYYFLDEVTVGANASVVVGMGQHEGCITDQEAAFYAEDAPSTHNISGLGGTFVFGHDGRLVITNATGATSLKFNQRYVNESDTGGLPSFGVSIASVNGDLVSGPSADGKYVIGPLDVPGVVNVPASMVGVHDDPDNPPVAAGDMRYQPSKLTHEPRPPTEPLTVAATAYKTGSGATQGAARVTWTEPEKIGGVAITEYTATASPGGQACVSTGALECIVQGLSHNTSYTFTVTATNSVGTSVASAASGSVRPLTTALTSPATPASPTISAPAAPAAPTVVRYTDNTVQVSWTAPNANNSPITSYAVTSTPAIDPVAYPCLFVSPTSCIIRNLPTYDPDDPVDPLDLFSDYTFTVTATNEMGTSPASPPSLTSILIPPAVGASPADPAPVTPPVVLPYEPDAILDIDLTSPTNAVTIDIPGYVAVPQGVVRLYNPNGLGTDTDGNTVSVSGGIVAAAFRVDDARANPGSGELTVPIGLVNPIVQRTYQIISRTTSGSPTAISTAVVQVNQNGAYAINSWEVQ